MLRSIGASSFDDLLSNIPETLRLRGDIDVPGPLSEPELMMHMERLAGLNKVPGEVTSFLGGGIYDHAVPAAVTTSRDCLDFYTAYTPYQAEVSQGTLQVIYEFQSLICRTHRDGGRQRIALRRRDRGGRGCSDGAGYPAEASEDLRVRVRQPGGEGRSQNVSRRVGVELVEIPLEGGVTDLAAARRDERRGRSPEYCSSRTSSVCSSRSMG